MMDPDFTLDMDEIRRVVDDADVFIVRFRHGERRLLVDARVGDGDPPMIRIVPRVSAAAERYRYLQQMRPKMQLPEQITVFTWPGQAQTMRDLGIWQQIEDRLVRLGGSDLATATAEAFSELVAAERTEIAAAIMGGEGFETLWERTTAT